jgi:hypothetical protein
MLWAGKSHGSKRPIKMQHEGVRYITALSQIQYTHANATLERSKRVQYDSSHPHKLASIDFLHVTLTQPNYFLNIFVLNGSGCPIHVALCV